VEGAAGVSRPLVYPVPWDLVAGLTPYLAAGKTRDLDQFTRQIVERMDPQPVYENLASLPGNPRFVLAANHFQRKGLWILHAAAALTQAISARYGPHPVPVRWMVTANWPRVRLGPLSFPSPGDWLLPKVAQVLSCYPVSFRGSNPAFTAHSIRRLCRDAKTIDRPIGIFPEGVAGSAGRLTEPLPGVDRLLNRLSTLGLPVVPVAVLESGGRLRIRIGGPLEPEQVLETADAARFCMERIGDLIEGR